MQRLYLLHGFMGTAQTHFLEQISFLEDNYELILLDLPGHGNNPKEAPEDYFEEALTYVIEKMKMNGEGCLIGLSLGASLAVHIALREPQWVNSIVLTGYTPYIPEELTGVMDKQYEYFLNIENTDKGTAEHFEKLHGEKWRSTLKNVLYTMTYNYPTALKEDISKIQSPILMLNGSKELHEVEAVHYVKKISNDAQVGLIPDAGHTANMDQPETYNKLLSDFLSKIS
ncbi:alpha/beta hydrolase [Halobacillus rhizosphaerae]|uniref:alpha/beta fold hydrolase n=1 Tax=Halobacillus rhizosphaerae TaxID=3064889 RepID=UPI00398BA181